MLHLLQFRAFVFAFHSAVHFLFIVGPREFDPFFFHHFILFLAHGSLNVLFLFKWKFDKETDFYRWNMQTNIRFPSAPFLLHAFYSLYFHSFSAENARCTSFTFVRAHHKIEICLYRKCLILLRIKRKKKRNPKKNQRSKEQQQLAVSLFDFIYTIARNSCTDAALS